jgi:hypothetical protein
LPWSFLRDGAESLSLNSKTVTKQNATLSLWEGSAAKPENRKRIDA